MFRLSNHTSRVVVWLIITGLLVSALVACATPTPEVIEKEVVVEKEVPVTVEVEKEKVVEKKVIETVVVEKEVVVEKVVTPTPGIPQGGTLIFASGLHTDIPFNPVMTSEMFRPGLWVFDTLVELAPDTSPAPSLAESWDISADGTVYTFKLREDVKWHDGEPFTADDVIFTFDAWLNDESSIYREDFVLGKDDAGNPLLVSAEKIDDYTVRFTLPKPNNQFLTNLVGWHGIVPKHLLEGQKMAEATAFNEHPIGTGPLKFVEYKSEQYVKFETNKDYWRGRPNLDGFIWQVIPDNDAQVTALANGEIDVIKNIYGPDMEARVNEIPGVTIYSLLGNYTRTFFMNRVTAPIFQEKAVREAIAYAFDKETIVKGVYGLTAPVAEQMFNPVHWGYNPDIPIIGYDPEKSQAVLKEAGWEDTDGDGVVDKDGQPLAFTILAEKGRIPDAQALQDYLKKVGIDAAVKQVERPVWREMRAAGEWEAFMGWDGSSAPETALSKWKTGGWVQYSNPRVDELLDAASVAIDHQERVDALHEVVQILAEEVDAIWYSYYQSKIAVMDYIGGLQLPPTTADFNNTGVFYHIENLYMKPH